MRFGGSLIEISEKRAFSARLARAVGSNDFPESSWEVSVNAAPPRDPEPIGSIPSPEIIRARLAQVVREANVLRRLLKVAELAEKDLGHAEPSCGEDRGEVTA